MPTNDYVPFANGGGANVVTQAAWVALLAGALAPGFAAGLAPSAQLNKAWRQPSVMAAAVGQALADILNVSILDDGNVNSLRDKIKVMLGSSIQYVGDTGAANAYTGVCTPAITAYTDNFMVQFAVAHDNTLASTINLGGGVVALLRSDGGAVQSGDVNTVQGTVLLRYHQSVNAFLIQQPVKSQLSGWGPAAAVSADVKTGTDAVKYVTSQALNQALGFSAGFVSAAQTITSAGALTLAHGIGRIPVLFGCWIKCTAGELGYNVGDVLFVAPIYQSTTITDDFGLSIVPDATNINVRFGGAAGNFVILNKGTGVHGTITNNKWQLYVQAWG